MEDSKLVCIIKNILYIPAFFMALGMPEQMAWSMASLSVLMMIDFVTGVAASIRINGIQSITSKIMTAGAVSKLLIILIPIIILIAGKGVGLDVVKYVQSGIAILVLSETYSNIGNIQSYLTGVRVPEGDAVSTLLTNIRKIILKVLNESKLIDK